MTSAEDDTFRQVRILVQAVTLVMQGLGITVSVGKSVIFKDTFTAIQNSSQMQRAIQAFTTAWNKAGNNPCAKANALFFFLKDSHAAGILWTIITSLCQEMTQADWLKTAFKVSAMLIASLATNGAALIARIVLFGLNASDLAENLKTTPQPE